MIKTDYKTIRDKYKTIQNSDDIDKSKQFYTTVDSSDGSYRSASLIAGRIMNDLQLLDQRGQLCISAQVTLKHNDHDFGAYYSVEIYTVEIEVMDDYNDEIRRVVDDYTDAGREQIESIIKKYQD